MNRMVVLGDVISYGEALWRVDRLRYILLPFVSFFFSVTRRELVENPESSESRDIYLGM